MGEFSFEVFMFFWLKGGLLLIGGHVTLQRSVIADRHCVRKGAWLSHFVSDIAVRQDYIKLLTNAYECKV